MSSAKTADWEVIDAELKYNKNYKLGSGGYGTVYKGKYDSSHLFGIRKST